MPTPESPIPSSSIASTTKSTSIAPMKSACEVSTADEHRRAALARELPESGERVAQRRARVHGLGGRQARPQRQGDPRGQQHQDREQRDDRAGAAEGDDERRRQRAHDHAGALDPAQGGVPGRQLVGTPHRQRQHDVDGRAREIERRRREDGQRVDDEGEARARAEPPPGAPCRRPERRNRRPARGPPGSGRRRSP